MSPRRRRTCTAGLALVALASLATGCSGGRAVPVTRENRNVSMPHYSFEAPVSRGWSMRRHGGAAEATELTRGEGPVQFRIQVFWSPIFDEGLRAATAREVADHVRQTERDIMLEQGVERGLYRLEDLVMSEQEIGGRTFYTMDYRTHSDAGQEWASLYLLLPNESGNDAFLLAHYAAASPPGPDVPKPPKPDFIALLESVALH